MLKLVYTEGSPGSRATRIVMDELNIQYESQITDAGATPDITPAMQVPCLIDDKRTIWEAPLIIEYLLFLRDKDLQIESEEKHRPLCRRLFRPEHEWDDKLALASVQTFGTSTATISQLLWTNVSHLENDFLGRCADRLIHLLDWYDDRIQGVPVGLFKDSIAVQDILLVCWLDFIDHRPLGLEWRNPELKNISYLFKELTHRQSFVDNPIEWWEP